MFFDLSGLLLFFWLAFVLPGTCLLASVVAVVYEWRHQPQQPSYPTFVRLAVAGVALGLGLFLWFLYYLTRPYVAVGVYGAEEVSVYLRWGAAVQLVFALYALAVLAASIFRKPYWYRAFTVMVPLAVVAVGVSVSIAVATYDQRGRAFRDYQSKLLNETYSTCRTSHQSVACARSLAATLVKLNKPLSCWIPMHITSVKDSEACFEEYARLSKKLKSCDFIPSYSPNAKVFRAACERGLRAR